MESQNATPCRIPKWEPADFITKRDRKNVADHDGKGVSVSEIPEERKTAEMTVLRATTPPFQGTGFDLSRRIADSAYHRCVRISDEGRRSRPLHGERIVQGIRRSPKTGRHAKARTPRFRAPLAARKKGVTKRYPIQKRPHAPLSVMSVKPRLGTSNPNVRFSDVWSRCYAAVLPRIAPCCAFVP